MRGTRFSAGWVPGRTGWEGMSSGASFGRATRREKRKAFAGSSSSSLERRFPFEEGGLFVCQVTSRNFFGAAKSESESDGEGAGDGGFGDGWGMGEMMGCVGS